MIRVLGIDPGGTTGLAFLYGFQHTRWRIDPAQAAGTADVMDLVQGAIRLKVDLVAVESFVVNRRAGRSRTAGAGEAARMIIGGVAQLCQEHGVRFVQRPAGVVKPVVTDRALDNLGLLAPTKGMPHARDAARHAVYAACHDLGLPHPMSQYWRNRGDSPH